MSLFKPFLLIPERIEAPIIRVFEAIGLWLIIVLIDLALCGFIDFFSLRSHIGFQLFDVLQVLSFFQMFVYPW